MDRQRQKKRQKAQASAVIFILLISLGFPGKYADVTFASLKFLLEYLAFGMELLLMMGVGDGIGFLNGKLVHLKAKYGAVYGMTAVFFINSMWMTAYPAKQAVTCIRFTVTVLFALWISEHYSGEEILRLIYKTQLLFVGFTLLFMAGWPRLAFISEVGNYDFAGILQTKNNAAAELSLGILCQITLFFVRKNRGKTVGAGFGLFLILQTTLLILCNAKGALFCAAVPALYLVALNRGRGDGLRFHMGIFYIIFSLGGLVLALTVLPRFEPLLNTFGKDATLTGRVPLWNQIISVMSKHRTMTGYGFGMFWRNDSAVALIHSAFSRYSFRGTMTTGAHNVLLELWLNVGLMGIASFFAAMLACFGNAEDMDKDRYQLCAAYILWFTLYGWTERAFSPYLYHTMFLFIVMGAACGKGDTQ